MTGRARSITAVVLDEHTEFTLGELCRLCRVHGEFVVELVEEGIVDPRGRDPRRWRFTGVSVRRVRRAVRLHRDLGLNLPGVALALELLDEIDRLRRERG